MKRPRPDADAPTFSHGDFVRRKVAKHRVGQVVAIVFLSGSVTYRIQFSDHQEEFAGFELEACEEPLPPLLDLGGTGEEEE